MMKEGNDPISKQDLKGKYVEFIDRNGAFRINKVIRIIGNTLTTIDALGSKERVSMDKVKWYVHHGHIREKII